MDFEEFLGFLRKGVQKVKDLDKAGMIELFGLDLKNYFQYERQKEGGKD